MNAYATELLKQKDLIEDKLNNLHVEISKARRGKMGLTLDIDKTPEWLQATADHIIAFNRLRAINQQLNKMRTCVGYEAINGKRVAIYKYKN